MKVSLGAFDGGSVNGNHEVIGAARVQIDFWDPEEGYYLNGTYYGDKNLLAIGGATQFQSGHTATTVDFLMERKLGNAGVDLNRKRVRQLQQAWRLRPGLCQEPGRLHIGELPISESCRPGQNGGKFEILGKYAKAEYTHGPTPSYDQKTTEINVNYVIKQFKARVMTFYEDTKYNQQKSDIWQAGLGLQLQI